MRLIDLYFDLQLNPRESERSDSVVRKWSLSKDAYCCTAPDNVSPDVYRQFCNLTAERVLYRRKVLALAVDEKILKNDDILSSRPFGVNGPTLQELMGHHVDVSMAFVPLTHEDAAKQPVLSRLYCVSGLECSYASPFVSEPPIAGKNWFLAGVADGEKPKDTSWYLAAHLTSYFLRRRSAKLHLATECVVTGSVEVNNAMRKVEIGRKIELANGAGDYRNLTWIVPFENRLETNMIEKVKYPKTIEEACKIVDELNAARNNDTQVLFHAVSQSCDNVEPTIRLLQNNADPCETIPEKMINAQQMLAENIQRRMIERMHKSIADLKEKVDAGLAGEKLDFKVTSDKEISEVAARDMIVIADSYQQHARAISYYASIPQMFFFFARRNDRKMIEEFIARGYDINSTDVYGETARDFAEDVDEGDAAEILIEYGATRRGRYELGSHRMVTLLMNVAGRGAFTGDELQYAKDAVVYSKESGLDLNAFIDFSPVPLVTPTKVHFTEMGCEEYTGDAHLIRARTNLFIEAALWDKSGEIVEMCLKYGAVPETKIEFYVDKIARCSDDGITFEGFSDAMVKKTSILSVVNGHGVRHATYETLKNFATSQKK